MRGLRVLLCAILVFAGGVVSAARAQTGFDRPGGDYTSVAVPSADPAACAARCERDGRCRAWSFSYPRTATPGATCWLKNRVTPRVENSCCVSGVKGAGVLERKSGQIEFSIDRTGGDYRSMDVSADPTGSVWAPPAKPSSAAAPGPMCVPAISVLRRAAS